MIKITNKVPLLNSPNSPCTGCDFTMNKYIAVEPNCRKIVEYDDELNKIREGFTEFPYSSITKNSCGLYYVVNNIDKCNLYITTEEFIEVDSISLKIPREYIKTIKSLDLSNKLNKILITNEDKCYSIDLNGNFITSEISNNATNTLIGNLFKTINPCGCSCPPIKKDYFTCGGYFCNNKYLAYTKDNSAYLALISENGNIIDNYFIADNIIINSILNVNGILKLLVTKNKKYNYIYTTDIKCDTCYNNKELLEITCHKQGNDYDYLEIINKACDKKCHPNNNYDIIESIALVEAAISHILNAEGEKIQKIIASSDNVDDILRVNDSVNKIVKDVTFLEQVLYSKLELVKDDKC